MKGHTASKKRKNTIGSYVSSNPINNQMAALIDQAYSHGGPETAYHISKKSVAIRGRAGRVYKRLFLVNNVQPLAECVAVSFPHKAKTFKPDYVAPQHPATPASDNKWQIVNVDGNVIDSFPTRNAARQACKNSGEKLSVRKAS